MKERGILFKGAMIRAILAGEKTQTRRLIDVSKLRVTLPKRVPADYSELFLDAPIAPPGRYRVKMNPNAAVAVMVDRDRVLGVKPNEFNFVCPYASGRTVLRFGKWEIEVEKEQRLWVRETWSHLTGNGIRTVYRADGEDPRKGWDDTPPEQRPPVKWSSAMFMPKKESRITLEVTRVRVERLHDITEQDARAEGVRSWNESYSCFLPEQCLTSGERAIDSPYRSSYAVEWDEINADRANWKSNPFVWAISFKVIKPVAAATAERERCSPT